MNNFTFLEAYEIEGSNKLDIIRKRGTKAAVTDFSILLGAYVSDCYTTDERVLKNRTGYYWTKTDDKDNDARAVWNDGIIDFNNVTDRDVGARPASRYSRISDISTNVVSSIAKDGILEIEYGYYPQDAVSERTEYILETNFLNGNLKKTGNTYATDSVPYDDYDKKFEIQLLEEYEFDNKRYVRIKSNNCNSEFMLSNGKTYKNESYVWIEVKPVKWLVDQNKDIMLSDKIIFGGVQFNNKRNYKGDFDKTDIKQFMDTHFSADLLQENKLENEFAISNLNNKNIRKQNPYNFDFSGVSEEEIIKGSLESNIPVFLHGRSSEGKSARVKQYDPDCEIIYLRNATPDSLNGKSVYNSETGEIIDVPPTWFKKICKKCEEEKDKLHIVFFDEITNALPSIQGMAFNIVLDKEVNGIWKLPNNARIVAAGNDLNDSLAANTMVEPLFNRFAHVYIHTDVQNWLKWAQTPKEDYQRLPYKDKDDVVAKIHPAIYSYIAYKSYLGEDVLRTKYDGEKPNADPRKWEMASKVLYATGKPEMLRALIGRDLAIDFAAFCKTQVISIEDVVNGNYSEDDINVNIGKKYATAVGLSSVGEDNLEVVREFVKKMGAEICATFDSLWVHGDNDRLEKIAELKLSDKTMGGMM